MTQYQNYRWFFTSSGKLVIGGKNSKQNEDLVQEMLKSSKDYLVIHTSAPGSPFSFIIEEQSNLTPKDIEETAIFTACFSKAWKTQKKSAEVHIFSLKQIYKTSDMKIGTFGVHGKIAKSSKTSADIIKTKKVDLKLYLTFQERKLRAVPFKHNSILEIKQGNLTKEQASANILELLKTKKIYLPISEIAAAIPSGNMKIN
jgi:hypothetical protein